LGKKWVSSTSKKRFAYPTKEEAVNAFRKRKERQVSILEERLRHARQALSTPESEFSDCTESLVML
jgi:hypothetical protein